MPPIVASLPSGAYGWNPQGLPSFGDQGIDLTQYASSFDAPIGVGGMSNMTLGGGDTAFGYGVNGAQMPVVGGGFKGWLSNGNNLGTVVQGLGALTSAYLGYQQLQQAKEALGFQKEAFNANLNNQISSYNTSLEDRIRGRTSDYAGKEADVQAYLDAHKLSRGG